MFVKITVDTNYVGTEKTLYIKVDDDSTDDYLNEIADDFAYENYSMYNFEEQDREDCEKNDIEYIPDEYYSYSITKLDELPDGVELNENLT